MEEAAEEEKVDPVAATVDPVVEGGAGYAHADNLTTGLIQQFPLSPQIYLAEDLHRMEKREKEKNEGVTVPVEMVEMGPQAPTVVTEKELLPLIMTEEDKERNLVDVVDG